MENSLYQLLQSNPIFQNIDRYDFGVIEDYLFFRGLNSSEVLFHEGTHGDCIAFVVAGRLEIYKHTTDGKIIHIAEKVVGDSVGDMSILDKLSRSASVRASERTGVILLLRPDFDRILIDHPHIGVKMLKGLANRLSLNLRETSEKLSKAKAELKAIEEKK